MRIALVASVLLAAACQQPEAYDYPAVVAGQPQVGAAAGTIDLPIGTPLGGFSARARYLTGQSKQDRRRGPYEVGFVPSTGIHTRPDLRVVWIYNGDEHLVLIKTATIYSNDKLVAAVADRLSEATGEDLHGKVVMTANHSHNSYGPFADQYHFYLGGDRYNEEIFQRYTDMSVDVALQAYERLQPAAIGAAWDRDWDPDNRVYRDRRGDNNELAVWDDVEPGYGKDPWVHMIRADSLDGDPIAAVFTFGIHGIAMGEDSPLVSSDAPGSLEYVLQEEWADDPDMVVMHMQGAGGDASPAGSDHDLARVESVGMWAREALHALWERTPTSSDPIEIEVAARHVPKNHQDIHVTRDGTVDWYYPPYEEGKIPDNEIWGEDGKLLAPFDEFNAPYGAAFCGGEALLPGANIDNVVVYPYDGCTKVDTVVGLIAGIFDVPVETIPLPLPESEEAGTLAAWIGGVETQDHDGSAMDGPLYMGFFPAEPTGMYAEQFRRRAKAELGWERALTVGYAMDHEGYFLIPEDWLMGGYEPNINLFGPLEGEHVMERMLEYSEAFLGTGLHEDPDPLGLYPMTDYPVRDLPTLQPDVTPNAGTRITEAPDYLWFPLENAYEIDEETGEETIHVSLDTPETVRRVQDEVWLAWEGGDAMVDLPTVRLQRLEGETWVDVTSRSGRPITDTFQDILVGHTPDPLYPADALQQHYYTTVWQAVGHIHDRAGLPLGTYRLHVSGHHYVGGDTTWPWTTEAYEVDTGPFEIVPAEITVGQADGLLTAAIVAPPNGWRLVDLQGDSRGANPLHGTVTVAIDRGTGDPEVVEVDAGEPAGGWSAMNVGDLSGAVSVTVTDAWGNTGTLSLE